MAHEDLGNVVGNLGAAQEAVNRNRKVIGDLERDADKRRARLAEEEAAEEKRVENVSRRSGEQRAARRANVAAAGEETAGIEAAEATRGRSTAAIERETAAIRANSTAKVENAAAEARKREAIPPGKPGAYRYPGAFGGTTQPPAYASAEEREAAALARRPQDPSVFGPKREDNLKWLMAQKYQGPIERYTQSSLYREAMGREPGDPLPVGISGGIGERTVKLEGDMQKVSDTFGKYAQRSGWIKRAAKARKEEAKAAAADAKVAAAEEVSAAETLVAGDKAASQIVASEEKRTFKWSRSPRSPGMERLVGTPYRVSEMAEDKYLLQEKKGRGFDVLDTYPTRGDARVAAHKRVLAGEAAASQASAKTQVAASEQVAAASQAEAAVVEESSAKIVAANEAQAASWKRVKEGAAQRHTLQGTPFSVLATGDPGRGRDFDVYEGERRISSAVTLREAKRAAERRAADAAIPAPPVVVKSDTPEGFYRAERAQRGARAAGSDLGTVTGDLTPARRAVKASPIYREKAREEASAIREGAAEVEKEVENAKRVEKEEQAIVPSPVGGGAGGGGGRRPPAIPAPLGGGGRGGGGGDGEGPLKKLVTAEEQRARTLAQISTLERDYSIIQQKTIAGYASSSQALQRHGALTAEFISALVRGEVTLREFQSQLTITIGKFAGWAVAGGLVYGAYEAIKHLAEGVTHTQTGVEQLKRSLGERVNVPAAEQGFRKLASEINVPIGGSEDSASTAQFYAARVYHDQTQSLELASIALKAYKLDNVNAQDAVKSFGAVAVAFSLGPKQLATVFDELDVGQLKFNARLNQTLPAVARASASFAAAGGTVKELVTQMIEIYRATGGGGGTGGGNPATALLREPANLTRPESARVLERYGFDAKYARTHIGQFNREVQEAAKAGKFPGGQPAGEEDLQALAKAAGAGAGVGYRYLLPLFRLGKTNLPEEVISETEKASGSAAEDLKHKLAQLDEQFLKLGIDFEIFGSKAGGTGIERTLTDIVGGLNLVVKGAELVITPFAQLGQVLSSLPAPMRQIAEAAGLFYGVRRLGRSELGLSARSLAGESKLFPTYAGGKAPELRSIITGQSKYLERVRNAQEAAFAEASIVGPSRIAPAKRAYEQFAATAVPVGETEQAAYYAELDRLQKRYLVALERGTELSARATGLQAEALTVEERLNLLRNKRMSVQARLLAAEEAGLFGVAAGGTPSSGAVIAPNARLAAEEQERIAAATAANNFGRSPGGVILPAGVRPTPPPLAGGAGAAPAAVESASGAAARSYSYLAGTYIIGQAAASRIAPVVDAATARANQMAGAVKKAGEGTASFARGLGPLGYGIAAFAGFSVLDKILGGSQEIELAASQVENLKSPTSEAALQQSLKKHGTGFFGKIGKEFTAIVSGVVHHPIKLFEDAITGQPFQFEKLEKVEADARKKLAEGKYKGLGAGSGGLTDAYLGTQTNIAESAFLKLEKASSSEDVEKTLQNVKKQVKLRLEEYKAFGAGSKFGDEDIAVLASQVHGAVTAFGLTGNTNIFEGYLQLEEQVNNEIVSDAQRRIGLLAKYGSKKDFAEGYKKAQAQVRAGLTKGQREGVADIQGEYDDAQKKLTFYERAEKRSQAPPRVRRALQLSGLDAQSPIATDTPQRAPDFYKDLAKQTKARINLLKQNLERLGLHGKEVTQALKEGQASIAHAAFEERVQPIRARGALASARAGGNRLLKAEAASKQFAEELKLADELRVKGLSRADVIGKRIDQIAAEDAERQEAIIGARLEGIGRRTGLDVSRLPSKDQVGRANREEEGARKELEYVRGRGRHNAYPSAGAKKAAEEDAETRLNNAKNSAGDARESVAKEGERSKKSEEAKQHHEEAKQKREEANRRYQEGIEAHAELRESLTEDPIKLDHIALDRDRKLLKGVSGIEAVRKKAAINRDIAKLHSDELSEKERDIDVNLQLEKIDQSTAIRLYKSLLHRKNLSKQVRQDLLLKVKSLEKEGDDNQTSFNVGNIRLPTLYEAKTFAPNNPLATSAPYRGPEVLGQRAQPTSAAHRVAQPQVNQTNHITVYVDGGDPNKVIHKLEHHFRTQTRHAMRSARIT